MLEASLIDLIADEEIRAHLNASQKLLREKRYFESLIETRKAFYLKFLKQFDIRPFEGKKDGEIYGMLDERSLCKAPYYAKSDRYIRKSVGSPLDYIVIDHSFLDSECLKAGVRPSDLWNVWRLTPKVIENADGKWLVKRTARLDEEIEKENAQYALDTLVDVLLSFQASNQKAKYRPTQDLWLIEAKPGTKIYTKCTRKSEVSHIVGKAGAYLSTSEANPAFDEDAYFWSVMSFQNGGPFYGGHLHEEDFDGILHPFDAKKLGLDWKLGTAS